MWDEITLCLCVGTRFIIHEESQYLTLYLNLGYCTQSLLLFLLPLLTPFSNRPHISKGDTFEISG